MHPVVFKVVWGLLLGVKKAFDITVRVAGPLFVIVGLALMMACGCKFENRDTIL
jgi:hypothetical protein